MAQQRQGKAGGRRIVAILGQLDAEPLGQRIGRQRAGDQPAAIGALDQRRVGPEILVGGEIAGDGGEQIGRVTSPSK
jgi:hypothetical protein